MSPEVPLPDVIEIELPDHTAFEENDVALLDGIRVASPCDASWEEMEGDDLVRVCLRCQMNVYNLSGMSRRNAAAFVREAEGRLCVRFYRRGDGTLLTDDCPVGWGAARRAVWRRASGAAIALASSTAIAVWCVDLALAYAGQFGASCGTTGVRIYDDLSRQVPVLLAIPFGGWLEAWWADFAVPVARCSALGALAVWITVMAVIKFG
jgi:hypothetical protein